MKPAIKDSENPFFHARYADLASVYEAIREPLAKNGLAVTQTLGNDPIKSDILIVETTLLHKSGEWIASKWCMPVPVRTTTKKDNQGNTISTTETLNDPQSVGGIVSYARRYSLSAILGVAADDDDAEKAAEHGKTGQSKPKTEKPVVGTATTGAGKEHWCAEHNTAYIEHSNPKGEHWWSHKHGDTYCNENKGKAKADNIPTPITKEHQQAVNNVIAPQSPEIKKQIDSLYGEEKSGTVSPTKGQQASTPSSATTLKNEAKIVSGADAEVDLTKITFKNQGGFYTACHKYLKLQPAAVKNESAMYNLDNVEQRAKAWLELVAVYGKKE